MASRPVQGEDVWVDAAGDEAYWELESSRAK